MEIAKDFKEFIQLLNSRKVNFVIVGGYALAFHGVPRNTGDIDLLIAIERKNAERIMQALDDFGMKSLGLTEKDFLQKDQVIQIGYPPLRIDILTSISGVTWDEVWNNRLQTNIGNIPVNIIGKNEFIINKSATGRAVDLGDISRLKSK